MAYPMFISSRGEYSATSISPIYSPAMTGQRLLKVPCCNGSPSNSTPTNTALYACFLNSQQGFPANELTFAIEVEQLRHACRERIASRLMSQLFPFFKAQNLSP